jgi:hypothetical protein
MPNKQSQRNLKTEEIFENPVIKKNLKKAEIEGLTLLNQPCRSRMSLRSQGTRVSTSATNFYHSPKGFRITQNFQKIKGKKIPFFQRKKEKIALSKNNEQDDFQKNEGKKKSENSKGKKMPSKSKTKTTRKTQSYKEKYKSLQNKKKLMMNLTSELFFKNIENTKKGIEKRKKNRKKLPILIHKISERFEPDSSEYASSPVKMEKKMEMTIEEKEEKIERIFAKKRGIRIRLIEDDEEGLNDTSVLEKEYIQVQPKRLQKGNSFYSEKQVYSAVSHFCLKKFFALRIFLP